MSEDVGYRLAPMPDIGALRVHPDPAHLPRLCPDEPGRNRFDDPARIWSVRYSAETLRGCLVETMARFRRDPLTEQLLDDVAGIEPGDIEHRDPTEALADWLSEQKVGIVRPDQLKPTMLDVDDGEALHFLDKHPLVQDALQASGLGTRLSPVHLDGALVRLGGPVGRPITQALARAAREWIGCDGIAYWSRLDSRERCWALWEDVPVTIWTEPLTPENEVHREAVQSVAAFYEILPPDNWA